MSVTESTVHVVDDDASFLAADLPIAPGERVRCKDIFVGS